jgi:outer membrane protein TolC
MLPGKTPFLYVNCKIALAICLICQVGRCSTPVLFLPPPPHPATDSEFIPLPDVSEADDTLRIPVSQAKGDFTQGTNLFALPLETLEATSPRVPLASQLPEALPVPEGETAIPGFLGSNFGTPPSFDSPSAYPLSLLDAVRIGLEQSKEVIVLGYEPSVDATLIQNAKSVFDPVKGVAAYGGQSDVQVRSEIQSFGSVADFLDTNFLRPFNRPNNLYLRRNLVSGGQAELGFSTDYEDYFPQGDQLIVNPGWDSALNFQFDQPLMRGLGVDSSLAPLKIAQAKYKESRYNFMAQIRMLSRDIELAYWEFASAERCHRVAKQLLAQVESLLDEESRRAELGQSALPNVLQVKSLYEEFRVLEMERGQLRDIAESRLRQIMGVDLCFAAESQMYTPSNNLNCLPLTATDNGEADSALQPFEATLPLALQRPEVMAQRAVVRAAKVDLIRARNDLKPDLSARVNYSVNGLDENLGNSIRTIARHEYNTWAVGVVYERPFGLRTAKADLDRAELTIAQETARLNQIEFDISHAVRRAEDKLHSAENILTGQERRVAVAQEQLDAYIALYKEGRVDIFLRVESERTLAAAKLEMVEAWRDKQFAIAERNFEANITSEAFEFAATED